MRKTRLSDIRLRRFVARKLNLEYLQIKDLKLLFFYLQN